VLHPTTSITSICSGHWSVRPLTPERPSQDHLERLRILRVQRPRHPGLRPVLPSTPYSCHSTGQVGLGRSLPNADPYRSDHHRPSASPRQAVVTPRATGPPHPAELWARYSGNKSGFWVLMLVGARIGRVPAQTARDQPPATEPSHPREAPGDCRSTTPEDGCGGQGD
jgi:hypothetical protein